MSPRRALVVIDVQNEYFGGKLPIEYPPVHATLPNIVRAMEAARAAGIPVVVVQNTAQDAASVFAKGTLGWDLHPDIAARPRDHHVEKALPSVFAGTQFADWIARHGIDTLTIVGYMTHNCDASTVFDAMHRGLDVEFLADASGAVPYENSVGRASAEEIHRVFSVVFQSRFAAVAATAQWIEALHSGTPLARETPLVSNARVRARLAAA